MSSRSFQKRLYTVIKKKDLNCKKISLLVNNVSSCIFLTLTICIIVLFLTTDSFALKNKTTLYDNDLPPTSFFKENRARLRKLMPANSVAIFFSNPLRNRSNDVFFEFHQDPSFYYFSGHLEPHSVLLIFKENQRYNNSLTTNEILYIQKKDINKELWEGRRIGVIKASKKLGITNVFSSTYFGKMNLSLEKFDKVITLKDFKDERNTNSSNDLYSLKKIFRLMLKDYPEKIDEGVTLTKYVAQLREIKSEIEITLLKKAIDITCAAQIRLMKLLSPSMKEYEAEAIVEYIFKKYGAEYTGFPSIHGAGENSCILHYVTNRKKFIKNDLLVNDIGAEYHNYTADVSRTLPVNGKFTVNQAIIYNIVLKAQKAAIKKCLPGTNFWTPHQTAKKIIAKELANLGIIKNLSDVTKYFMHGTSHYLGLDVHDAGLFKTLKKGNVITVEPGIYIPKGAPCDKKWWNIGVRIEDDILITDNLPLNLSEKAPREIKEIESLMNKK